MNPADLSVSLPVDCFRGQVPSGGAMDASALGHELLEAKKKLLAMPVDEIISILDDYSSWLLTRDNQLHRHFPSSGLAYVASWCRSRSLAPLLDECLGDRHRLDQYSATGERSSRELRAWPRGLVLHWIAGNVPTLGFLSMLMGILTKNANLVKLPFNQDALLTNLIQGLAQIPGGEELAAALAVVRFHHDNLPLARAVSYLADVRMIWGSDESVAAVRALPAKLETVDIVFPNRVSFIVVSSKLLEDGPMERLAQRMAQDISIFEQKACASPHTVFLETGEQKELEAFAQLLAQTLENVLRTLPKTPPSQREVAALLNLRAEYDMFHQAWYSQGTEFTILADDKPQLGPAIGNRTIFLRKMPDLTHLSGLITPKVQTVGIAAQGAELNWLTDFLAAQGVQRFTRVGGMTSFDMPWDGFLLPQNLVRWTSRAASGSGL